MKRILLFFALFYSIASFAQTPVYRSSSVVTALDSRWGALLNMKIPVCYHIPSLNGGLDSLGSMVYVVDSNSIFFRDSVLSGGHKWTKLLNANSVSASWSLTGNSETTAGANFLGTTDNQPLYFKSNNNTIGILDAQLSNTIFGVGAMQNNSSGLDNVALGSVALQNNTTGNVNIGIGQGALATNTTGFDNIAIGQRSDVLTNNLRSAIAIGTNTVVGQSRSVVFGGNGASHIYVRVGINTSTPLDTLTVVGTGSFTDTLKVATVKFNTLPLSPSGTFKTLVVNTSDSTIRDTSITIPSGTITGVTAGIDLTGGGTSGTVTLNADTTIGATKLPTQGFVQRQGYLTTAVTNLTGVNTNGFTWSIANPSTTPAITLTQQNATTSQSGQLTSTDWNTFNGKLSNITGLVTAGTNVTIGGSGTSGSPYVINSTGGGGGTDSMKNGYNIRITGLGTAVNPHIISGRDTVFIVPTLDPTNSQAAARTNTIAINNAISSANGIGKAAVRIPIGKFYVHTIELIPTVQLEGFARNLSFLEADSACSMLHINYNAHDSLAYRMRVNDIALVGNNVGTYGMDLNGVSNSVFEQIDISGFSHCLHAVDYLINYFYYSTFESCSKGIYINSSQSISNENYFVGCVFQRDTTWAVDFNNASLLVLDHCDIGGNGTNGDTTTGTIHTSNTSLSGVANGIGIIQHGGWMEDCRGGFIYKLDSSQNSVVNEIDGVTINGTSAKYGFYVTAPFLQSPIDSTVLDIHDCLIATQNTTNSSVAVNSAAYINLSNSPGNYASNLSINGGIISGLDNLMIRLVNSNDSVYAYTPTGRKVFQYFTGGANAWTQNGNAAVSGSSLGTTNSTSLRMITNNIERAWIDSVGTGCTNCNMFHVGSRASGNGLSLWNFDNAGTTVLMNGTGTTLSNNFLDFSGSSLLIDNLATTVLTNNGDFRVSAGSSTGSYINSTGLMIGTNTGGTAGANLSVFGNSGSSKNTLNTWPLTTDITVNSNTDDGYGGTVKADSIAQRKFTSGIASFNSVGTLVPSTTITSGTYTPTLTNVTNISSSTANQFTYSRNGSIVTYAGSIQVTTSIAATSEVDFSLPIASAFTSGNDLNGVGQAKTAIGTNVINEADDINDRGECEFIGLSVGGTGTVFITGQYIIK